MIYSEIAWNLVTAITGKIVYYPWTENIERNEIYYKTDKIKKYLQKFNMAAKNETELTKVLWYFEIWLNPPGFQDYFAAYVFNSKAGTHVPLHTHSRQLFT